MKSRDIKEQLALKKEVTEWLDDNNFELEFSYPQKGKPSIIIMHGTNIILNQKRTIKEMDVYSYSFIWEYCRNYLRDYKIESLLKEEIRNDKINEITND